MTALGLARGPGGPVDKGQSLRSYGSPLPGWPILPQPYSGAGGFPILPPSVLWEPRFLLFPQLSRDYFLSLREQVSNPAQSAVPWWLSLTFISSFAELHIPPDYSWTCCVSGLPNSCPCIFHSVPK